MNSQNFFKAIKVIMPFKSLIDAVASSKLQLCKNPTILTENSITHDNILMTTEQKSDGVSCTSDADTKKTFSIMSSFMHEEPFENGNLESAISSIQSTPLSKVTDDSRIITENIKSIK
jgi:hypothetical protein